jgi:predicted phosphoribosyltransferase
MSRLFERLGAAHDGGMARLFRDRADAGRRLADRLEHLRGREGLLVLGLPRGGVVVAEQVARALGAPLDVLVVRKLGFPGHEELALGAVASGGAIVVNDDVLAVAGMDDAELQQRAAARLTVVEEMEQHLRGDRPPLELAGRPVVLVDDGLATGATMRVAAIAARRAGASEVVVAAPVGSPDAVRSLDEIADEVICVDIPVHLRAVGLSYRDFSAVEESEVQRLLQSFW